MKGPTQDCSEVSSQVSRDLETDLKHEEGRQSNKTPENENPSKQLLRSWLNKTLKIVMSDGRILIGVFLCTDREGNLILGGCQEFLKAEDSGSSDEPRVLGLVMVPGRHIVQMYLDKITH